MKSLFLISVALFALSNNGITSAELRAETLKCYVCNSLQDENCADGPYDDYERTCGTDPFTDPKNPSTKAEGPYRCAVTTFGDVVARGCVTSIQITACELQSEFCKMCSSDLCNSGIITSGTLVMTTLLGFALYFVR